MLLLRSALEATSRTMYFEKKRTCLNALEMDCAVDIIVDSVLVVDGSGNECERGIALGGSSLDCRSMAVETDVEAGLC